MSCNKYLTCYSSYYGGYPACSNACQNICQPVYNLCQPTCQPCVINCPTPVPVTVTYINTITAPTAVPSGGIPIPAGTVIPAGTFTVPAGTVTVITGYNAIPLVNTGGITVTNGFFTTPVAGRYNVVGNTCFAAVATITDTDIRELSIYKVEAATGLVTRIAVDSRSPIASSETCINVATIIDMNIGDRLFLAARQSNAAGATVITSDGRISIARIC